MTHDSPFTWIFVLDQCTFYSISMEGEWLVAARLLPTDLKTDDIYMTKCNAQCNSIPTPPLTSPSGEAETYRWHTVLMLGLECSALKTSHSSHLIARQRQEIPTTCLTSQNINGRLVPVWEHFTVNKICQLRIRRMVLSCCLRAENMVPCSCRRDGI